jgi:hypothetical protein
MLFMFGGAVMALSLISCAAPKNAEVPLARIAELGIDLGIA